VVPHVVLDSPFEVGVVVGHLEGIHPDGKVMPVASSLGSGPPKGGYPLRGGASADDHVGTCGDLVGLYRSQIDVLRDGFC